MEDAEAEAVLLAVGPLVEWRPLPGQGVERTWRAWHARCDITEDRGYWLFLREWHTRDLGADAQGRRFQWELSVELVERVPPWYREDGTRMDNAPRRRHWRFPCHTEEDAKALCNRLAATDDTAEVEQRDAQRYPLVWTPSAHLLSKYGRRPEEEVAEVRRHYSVRFKFVAYYTVFVERRGHWCRYHAGYRLTRTSTRRTRLPNALRRSIPSNALRRYSTATAAKAACERHYATGRWE